VTIPTTTPLGTYYLLACADDVKKVPESNEKNNCKASASTVTILASTSQFRWPSIRSTPATVSVVHVADWAWASGRLLLDFD
jgi:hypothetical protein